MSAGGRGEPTLGHVVEALGPETVRLLTPSLSGAFVGGPRLWDADDQSALAPGDVVIGLNVTDPDEVLAHVAAAQVSALALKGDVAHLADAAERAGVALVAVSREVRWEQLYALLQQAVSSVRVAEGAEPMGDLFAFANALAALVGGAVSVEDPSGSLLAYSNLDQPIDEARRQTILGRGQPATWTRLLETEGYARQLARSDGPVRISDTEGRANERIASLVRAGSEVLAILWVVAGDTPLGPEAEQVVADALPLAAMHLLRQRGERDSGRRARGELLRALLAGEAADVGRLGIDPGTTCQLVAFALEAVDDDVRLVTGRTRLMDAVTLAGEAFRRRVVCTSIDSTVYALFPDVRPDTTGRLLNLVADICARSEASLGLRVLAGVSEPHDGVPAATTCRAEADRAVRVLQERGGATVAAFRDVRIPSVLLTLSDLVRERDDLRVPGVQTLVEHDAEHGKPYVDSLRAYLRASGSIPGSAAALGIHPNTMRYRIARIEEISGLVLDDPDHRLVATLELLALS